MGQEHSVPCELRQHPPSRHSGYCSGADYSSADDAYSRNARSHRSQETKSHHSHKSGGSTDSCSTGSDYSRHPDPGTKRTKGSSISRTDSDSSSDSRNRLPIYTNVHYRDVNNNIYKPLKIGKNKIHRLKILDADKDTAIYLEKHLSIKSYLGSEEVKKIKEGPQLTEPIVKKAGIRNYTPKILSEKNMQKDLEHWI